MSNHLRRSIFIFTESSQCDCTKVFISDDHVAIRASTSRPLRQAPPSLPTISTTDSHLSFRAGVEWSYMLSALTSQVLLSKMSGHDRDLSEMLEEYMPDFSAVSHEINKVADYIDSVSDSISSALRESIDRSSWIPASMRKPSAPPRAPVVATPLGYFDCSRDWISRHRTVTVAVACFFGTGFFLIWRRRKANRAKRRARRAKNGQRTEVVVLAGSPHAPMTRSLSLDLERRGFVVYIPVNSLSEERLIQAEAKADIRPLHLDVTEVCFSFPPHSTRTLPVSAMTDDFLTACLLVFDCRQIHNPPISTSTVPNLTIPYKYRLPSPPRLLSPPSTNTTSALHVPYILPFSYLLV